MELIVDNFAGGGGASTGIELALGRRVDIAINHDPDAIAMHRANHPHTLHIQDDVWKVNPVEICHGAPVLLAWFSPDCKHFSKAKGAKPVEKKIRGLAWVALRWAGLVRPKVIFLENVEEFKTWGPIRRGRPIKAKSGTTFKKFIKQFEELGYKVEYRELIAADYGAPTKRKRFFMIARCDGKPIRWPEKTHSPKDKKLPGQKTWRSASEILDFSLPTKSIFNRDKELAEATKKRIGRGLCEFVLNNKTPFIIPIGYGESKTQAPRIHDIGEPLPTVVSGNKHHLVTPYLADFNFSNKGNNLDDPYPTQTTVKHHSLMLPYMSMLGHTGFSQFRDEKLVDPLKTIVTKNEHLLISPMLIPMLYYKDEKRLYDIHEPHPTITAGGQHSALAIPFLSQYLSHTVGTDAKQPVSTVMPVDKNALIVPFLSQNFGGGYKGAGSQVEQPTPTITSVDHNRLIEAKVDKIDENYLVKYYKVGSAHRVENPIDTLTTRVRYYLIKSTLIKIDVNQLPNLGNWNNVRKFLNEYCGYTIAEDELLVFNVNETTYFMFDIGMRMLTPRELYDAQGFPHDYIIDRDADGKYYSATKQIARCGNAVPPPFAEALVRANLPEYAAQKKIDSMKVLTNYHEQLSLNLEVSANA